MFARFAIALAFASLAFSQTTTASLLGVVHDNSGAVLPDAAISALNVATGFERSVASDSTGAYLLTNLPIGEYKVTATKQGFTKAVLNGITLVVDQNARVDISLNVGNVAESIVVDERITGVETRATSVGEIVDRMRIQELPLNGRNTMSLARTVPGVISVSTPTVQTQSRSGPSIKVRGPSGSTSTAAHRAAPRAST